MGKERFLELYVSRKYFNHKYCISLMVMCMFCIVGSGKIVT